LGSNRSPPTTLDNQPWSFELGRNKVSLRHKLRARIEYRYAAFWRIEVFRVIMVAIDGSEAADNALSLARDLALEQRSRLLVVHVEEMMGHETADRARTRRATHKKIEDQVSKPAR
jgi:hypothetical protein